MNELFKAAQSGDLARVTELLARGADLTIKDINGYTALHCAADKGHAGVVTGFISKQGLI